ncbi:metallo-beta-lactamase class B [Novosphingobium sp. PhB165]|uniref:subclass B3 metallo-beta-lactamase n=1 Tax=Novosphingobium sp. PhB165 TaxID=2485105 RepID=UPI00105129B0|nr:subclass B3 metallo-beta-lactamase [Novosphingobium sp. PhB165]TCM21414.1 metallo-beta-lactamase class B [Novosphingobium sp. PhB165]
MNRLPNILAPALLLAACSASPGAAASSPETASANTANNAGALPAGTDAARLVAACKDHDGWAYPAPPARLFGNSWYVGTCGISAILITGKQGHVLIDGGVPEAAPLVLANIKAAGFNPKDVRWILSTHEHFDHAGALGALQRETGARVAALPAAAQVLESGKADAADPQFGQLDAFPPVHVDRRLTDGEKLTLGTITLTAHSTPAHAAGSTSWTWRSCDDAGKCLTIAYADSVSAISVKSYRFTDHPERIAAVREGYARIAELPCDLLVSPHPGASDLFARLAGTAPLVDPTACRKYAAAAHARFDQRLAEEAAPEAKETHS